MTSGFKEIAAELVPIGDTVKDYLKRVNQRTRAQGFVPLVVRIVKVALEDRRLLTDLTALHKHHPFEWHLN